MTALDEIRVINKLAKPTVRGAGESVRSSPESAVKGLDFVDETSEQNNASARECRTNVVSSTPQSAHRSGPIVEVIQHTRGVDPRAIDELLGNEELVDQAFRLF